MVSWRTFTTVSRFLGILLQIFKEYWSISWDSFEVRLFALQISEIFFSLLSETSNLGLLLRLVRRWTIDKNLDEDWESDYNQWTNNLFFWWLLWRLQSWDIIPVEYRLEWQTSSLTSPAPGVQRSLSSLITTPVPPLVNNDNISSICSRVCYLPFCTFFLCIFVTFYHFKP